MQYICSRSRISRMGKPTYYFGIFPPKLHEIEKKLDPEGVHVPSAPLDIPI